MIINSPMMIDADDDDDDNKQLHENLVNIILMS